MSTKSLVQEFSEQLFYNSPNLKIARVSINRKIDKIWPSHTLKYYLVIKKMDCYCMQ